LEVLGGSESDLLAGFKKTIPVKAALVHPCQIFRPAEVMQFDDADHPRVMEKLVQAAAKSLVGYSFQNRCCGASLTMSNLAAAYQIGRTRLEELAAKGAEVIITACGNCHLLLHCRQSEYYNGRPIPCLFLPQLLGLALGFSADDLMIYDAQLRSLTGNV
ncbi:MAG: heterodisulfide reductase-related iron-sulfur binding cluster, partial [Syntrophomonadaceae bacterium]